MIILVLSRGSGQLQDGNHFILHSVYHRAAGIELQVFIISEDIFIQTREREILQGDAS